MRGFVRVGDHYAASLDAVERRILAAAVADTAELLGVLLGAPEADPPGSVGSGRPEPRPDDPLRELRWDVEATAEPADPAVARLLPAASREDEELAGEFRRLTDADLRRTKIGNLRLVWTGLRGRPGPLAVPRDEASRWAAALTDVRLVLATRLGIESDDDAELVYGLASGDVPDGGAIDEDDEDDEEAAQAVEVRRALATLYGVLTWLQESLVTVMLDDEPR